MIIIGIESSCDETAIALVRDGKEVLSSVIASQTKIHERWGGVVPEIAAREHLTALKRTYQSALESSKISPNEIDAIAVTQGPGLIGCLLIGTSFAKGLSQSLQKPLIPVNHVHAHIHGALLGIRHSLNDLFPALALVVSGGHTNLYLMNGPTSFELLAHTIDDACGESFDKVGKMLGLPYPGGPHVEKLAASGNSSNFSMPVMLERRDQMAFSYSGLKTAVANHLRSASSSQQKADIAASFQKEACGQLIRKIKEAYKLKPEAKSVIIAGGVAANSFFKSSLQEAVPIPCHFPAQEYCSDNGAMIAALGYHEFVHQQTASNLEWDVFSRYPFEKFKTLKADSP